MLCQAFSQPTWAEGTQVIAKLKLSVLLVMISMCNFQALTKFTFMLQDLLGLQEIGIRRRGSCVR